MFNFDLMQIVAGLPGLIIAMVVHEYAHARVAVYLGDFTPRLAGRLTLNPAAHIDPIGLICLFLVHFGWAKPVMINPRNFKNPRQGDVLVSLAGPAANLITAFLSLIVLIFFFRFASGASDGLILVFRMIIEYNIGFAIFNLLPLPPLDGSHILRAMLPPHLVYRYDRLERYSIIILLVLLMTPILSMILIPLRQLVWSLFEFLLTPLLMML